MAVGSGPAGPVLAGPEVDDRACAWVHTLVAGEGVALKPLQNALDSEQPTIASRSCAFSPRERSCVCARPIAVFFPRNYVHVCTYNYTHVQKVWHPRKRFRDQQKFKCLHRLYVATRG